MEKIIEHEGKKYRAVEDKPFEVGCNYCCLEPYTDLCNKHQDYGFPHCTKHNCHFELIEETTKE